METFRDELNKHFDKDALVEFIVLEFLDDEHEDVLRRIRRARWLLDIRKNEAEIERLQGEIKKHEHSIAWIREKALGMEPE
jgi:hypothetical protein